MGDKWVWGQLRALFLVTVMVVSTLAIAPTGVAAQSSTIVVDDDGGSGVDYTTIQAAVDNANSGDTIEVRAGTYSGTIDIQGIDDLTIRGVGSSTMFAPTSTVQWGSETNFETRTASVRVVDSTDVNITNMTMDFNGVDDDATSAILYWDSTGRIADNTIRGMSNPNSFADLTSYFGTDNPSTTSYTSDDRARILIEDNRFVEVGRIGINADDFVNVTVRNNSFRTTDAGYAVEIGSEATGVVRNNDINGFNTSFGEGGPLSAGIYVENAYPHSSIENLDKPVLIADNEIQNSHYAVQFGQLYDGIGGDVDIRGELAYNHIHHNEFAGVRIVDENAEDGSSVTVNAHDNLIENNNIGYDISIDDDLSEDDDEGDITVNLNEETIRNHTDAISMTDPDPSDSVYDVSVTDTTVVNTTGNVYDTATGSASTVNDLTVRNATAPDITVSFEAQDVSVASADSVASLPTGYREVGQFINASSNAPGGYLDLTIPYDQSAVDAQNIEESTLSVWTYDSEDGWVEVGGTVDTAANTVSATVSSFSTIALLGQTVPNFQVNIDSTNSPVVAGGTLSVTATITNTGTATDTQTIEFSAGGSVRDSTTVTLGGTSSQTVTLSWDTTTSNVGSYAASVSSEDEEASTSVSVLAPTNFVASIDSTNSPVAPGDTLSVTATVSNTGDVSDTQIMALSLDGALQDTQSVSLGGGQSQTITLRAQVEDAGEYTAMVASNDPDSTASDSTTVTVAPERPNFDVVGLVANESVAEGDRATFRFGVENTGPVEGTQTVTLSVNGSERDSQSVTLGAGERQSVTLSWGTGAGDAGSYTATVASDNDSASTGLTVVSETRPTAPDFGVAVDSTNSPVEEGDTLSVTATVSNTGNATGTQTVTLSLNGSERDSQSVTLGAGNSTTVTLSVSTGAGDAGTYTATVASENDSASTGVTVEAESRAAVDFGVTIDSTNSPVEENETLNVTATVSNTGNATGTQTVTLSVNGSERDSQSVSLDAGNSTTVTLSWGTGAGDAGSYTATVASENDSASTGVTVESGDEDQPPSEAVDRYANPETGRVTTNGLTNALTDWSRQDLTTEELIAVLTAWGDS